jgi:hypothetical protein
LTTTGWLVAIRFSPTVIASSVVLTIGRQICFQFREHGSQLDPILAVKARANLV